MEQNNEDVTKTDVTATGATSSNDGDAIATPNDNEEVVIIDDVECKVDANGNALDKEGNVFKTKEELAGLQVVDDTVKLGDIEYKKNDNGDIVDEEGNVVYSREEAISIENPTGIIHLMETVGIKPIDTKGNRIIYPDTVEGHTAYMNDVATIRENAAVNKAFNTYLSRNPDIQAVIKHKQIYGTLDNYSAKTDYSNIQLDKDNTEMLENVILTARIKRGDTPEKAKKYIEFLKKENGLFDEATTEQAYITQSQVRETQLKEAARIKQEQANIDANNQYWGEVQTTIRNGIIKVDGIEYKIPEVFQLDNNGRKTVATKEDFFNYMYQPIKYKDSNGQESYTTQFRVDEDNFYNKNGVNAEIFNAMSLFMNKPTKFIQEQIKTQRTKEIKKYVSTIADKAKQQATGSKANTGKIDYNKD